MRRTLALLIVVGAAGCHHRRAAVSSPASCVPAAPQVAREMDLPRLNGAFAITFVATDGARAGQSVTGRLVLHPQDARFVPIEFADTSVVVSQPTIGQLDLALENVGATRMGDPMAESSAMPGVGFYVTRRRGGDVTSVVGRVGSQSNARGVAAFDGGYFAMYLQRVSSDGLGGTWASSSGSGIPLAEAHGHFCATRLTTTTP